MSQNILKRVASEPGLNELDADEPDGVRRLILVSGDTMTILENSPERYLYDAQHIIEMFLDDNNETFLVKQLYNMCKRYNSPTKYSEFKERVPLLMQQWERLKYIRKYRSEANDIIEELDALNRMFLNDAFPLFDIKDPGGIATDFNGLNLNKKSHIQEQRDDLMNHEVYHNADVWKNQETFIHPNIYRYNNSIPVYRTSIHTRNYERDNNEGLRGRGELEQFTSKYDTSATNTSSLYEWLPYTNY